MDVDVNESEIEIVRWTREEWVKLANEGLEELGVTYEELKRMSEERDFESAEHIKLWMAIGGTL